MQNLHMPHCKDALSWPFPPGDSLQVRITRLGDDQKVSYSEMLLFETRTPFPHHIRWGVRGRKGMTIVFFDAFLSRRRNLDGSAILFIFETRPEMGRLFDAIVVRKRGRRKTYREWCIRLVGVISSSLITGWSDNFFQKWKKIEKVLE